ncbi:hypothetical protein MXB_2155 [Myxobolus squamalis]|nr:hypothetical protein MXB_2155 [Myxobolus squamalis]
MRYWCGEALNGDTSGIFPKRCVVKKDSEEYLKYMAAKSLPPRPPRPTSHTWYLGKVKSSLPVHQTYQEEGHMKSLSDLFASNTVIDESKSVQTNSLKPPERPKTKPKLSFLQKYKKCNILGVNDIKDEICIDTGI